MVRTVLPPDDSAASPPVDATGGHLRRPAPAEARRPPATPERPVPAIAHALRRPTSTAATSTSTSIPGRPPDDPRTTPDGAVPERQRIVRRRHRAVSGRRRPLTRPLPCPDELVHTHDGEPPSGLRASSSGLGAPSSTRMPRPRPSRALSTRFPTAVLLSVDIALSGRPTAHIVAASRTRTQHVGGVVHSHPQDSCGYSHPRNACARGGPQVPTCRDKSRQDRGFPPETCGRAGSYTPCGRHHHARSVHSSVDSCG